MREVKLHSSVGNNSGFILIVAMLFLSILSLLAFSMLEVNLLENKMSAFFQDKVQSFYQAEEYLSQAEEQINAGGLPANANVSFNDITSSISGVPCEVIFYRLKATANHRGTESVLWSTFLKVRGDTRGCNSRSKVVTGRQSFWIEH